MRTSTGVGRESVALSATRRNNSANQSLFKHLVGTEGQVIVVEDAMRSHRLICLLGIVFAAASTAAGAQNAFTAHRLNLRTGPDRSYPPVTQLAAGAPVQIMGCLSDWSWCDVVFDDDRGWAYAPGLTYAYQGTNVPFYSYAPSFGIPIVTFSLGAYWDRYYRGKPWFSQRSMWLNRRLPPHRRPPGPAPHAGPPPHAGPAQHAGARPQVRGRPPAPGRSGTNERRGQEQRGQPQRKPSETGPQGHADSPRDERRGDQTQDNPR